MTDDFLAARFPESVCDMVDALTRQDGEDYEGFIRRAVKTAGTKLVEEADIQDDATRSRLQEKYEWLR